MSLLMTGAIMCLIAQGCPHYPERHICTDYCNNCSKQYRDNNCVGWGVATSVEEIGGSGIGIAACFCEFEDQKDADRCSDLINTILSPIGIEVVQEDRQVFWSVVSDVRRVPTQILVGKIRGEIMELFRWWDKTKFTYFVAVYGAMGVHHDNFRTHRTGFENTTIKTHGFDPDMYGPEWVVYESEAPPKCNDPVFCRQRSDNHSKSGWIQISEGVC